MLSSAQRDEFDRRGILRLRLAPRYAGPGTDHAGRLRPPRARARPRWRHAGDHRLAPADHAERTPGSRRPGPLTRGEGLRTLHPWLHDLWNPRGDTGRIHRYLTEGADIDGIHVQVEELTGEPGDAIIMNPRLLHVVAPNSLDTPRLMLLQFVHRRP